MKKILFILLFLVSATAFSQVITLDLLNRNGLTTAQMNSITVADGLVEGGEIRNTDTNTIWRYNGTIWEDTGSGGGGSPTTDASDLTTGVLDNGRVQESNVTQHQSALNITESQISDFGTYLTSESDPIFTTSDAFPITAAFIANWQEAYSWGDHGAAGYLLAYDWTSTQTGGTGGEALNIWHSTTGNPSTAYYQFEATGLANSDYDVIRKIELDAAISGVGGGGGLGGSIADNQIAIGNGTDAIDGSDNLTWDGTQLGILGPSADRYVRFSETSGQFNGAYIQFEGSTNKLHLGVHDAADANPVNDNNRLTIQRSDGFIGINNESPAYELDVNGTLNATGARIAPTFADFAGRFSTGGTPSFGGSRLGDSDLQTESLDIGSSINFIDGTTPQQVNLSIFENNDVVTMRSSGGNRIGVLDFNGGNQAIWNTDDTEATFAATINFTDGKSYVNDFGVQRYIPGASVVAQTFFHVLQNLGGADEMDYWFGRYDGTTYDEIFSVNASEVVDFTQTPTVNGTPITGSGSLTSEQSNRIANAKKFVTNWKTGAGNKTLSADDFVLTGVGNEGTKSSLGVQDGSTQAIDFPDAVLTANSEYALLERAQNGTLVNNLENGTTYTFRDFSGNTGDVWTVTNAQCSATIDGTNITVGCGTVSTSAPPAIYQGSNAIDPSNEQNNSNNIDVSNGDFTVAVVGSPTTDGAFALEFTRVKASGTAAEAFIELPGTADATAYTISLDAQETVGTVFDVGLQIARGWTSDENTTVSGTMSTINFASNTTTSASAVIRVRSFGAGNVGDKIVIDNLVIQ